MIALASWLHRRLPFGWLPTEANNRLIRWAWNHAPDPEAPEAVREWWLALKLHGERIPQVPRFGQGGRP